MYGYTQDWKEMISDNEILKLARFRGLDRTNIISVF